MNSAVADIPVSSRGGRVVGTTMGGYQRIATDLAHRIVDGEFPLGGRLPTEQRLAADYGVARGTVRHALATLARQGMVVPRQGTGWIIHSTLATQSFAQQRSFAQWARSKGLEPSGRVMSSAPAAATPQEALRLRVSAGEEVLRVTRVRSLDGRVAMLERTTYAPWVAGAVARLDDDEPSVVSALEERFGIVTAFATHRMDAVAASTDDAGLLGVRRSSPLMRVRRESSSPDGRVIELGEDRYLPGTVAFEVHTSAGGERFHRMPAES